MARLTLRCTDQGGIRLDRFLSVHAVVSRTHARWLIDFGAVYLNGSRVRVASRIVRSGDQVLVHRVDPKRAVIFELGTRDILFHDEHLLALNKPAGVNSQPTPAQYRGCVYEAVLRFLGRGKGGPVPAVGMPQRLDRDVSGVMVLSLSRAAHKSVTEAFRTNVVQKTYWAICTCTDYDGPEHGAVTGRIGRVSGNDRFGITEDGKRAETSFRIIEERDGHCLVEARPHTGRTHQIRIHLSSIGLPVVGDPVYGQEQRARGRGQVGLLLHATRLELSHPTTGRPLMIEAPLPDRFGVSRLRSVPAADPSGPSAADHFL